ncbi:MAG: DUF3108 domain-containing protein [Acidobacteriota bacterium]|nr:DUF3108 domain-containing protein [Acidobacteriota bacterium]MDH3529898.1 DUF3108 domain-containing protein [Acidobacteriota bacterium]
MGKSRNNPCLTKDAIVACLLVAVVAILAFAGIENAFARRAEYQRFPAGEKLTYNVSFEKFRNAAYAEVYVVSKGTIDGKAAVELRGKIKSVDLVSAAFFLFDRSRTVFASIETGLPLYIRDVSKDAGLPVETISNFLSDPATNLDLLTLFYRARENGGAGSFSVIENGRNYSFDFALTGGEVVRTSSEEYQTVVSAVSSEYFQENGISDVRVYFSTGTDRIPVKISVKTPKGEFNAILASSTRIVPTPVPTVAPTVAPTPVPTVVPTPSPTPYIVDQKLSSDLPFKIGERLKYSVVRADREVARVLAVVDGRELVDGVDSLLLKATVAEAGDGSLFRNGDIAEVWVDPYTLVPSRFKLSFTGSLSGWTEEARFDQVAGTVTSVGAEPLEVPNGTHSIISLAYAIRSFNLRPSKDPKNPVNDTRVSAFINGTAYILTLRPDNNERIEIGGESIVAQPVTIFTGDNAMDRLQPKVWLSADARRIPLRIIIGEYRANLIK